MKIMAIDYGRMRVGIALTDPLGVIAQPYLTLTYKSQSDLIKRLKCIIQQNQVGLILVGNPVSMNGRTNEMSEKIQNFVKKMQKSLNIKVQLWDERFTSKYAANILKEHGIKQTNLDEIAASLMLEEYLKRQADMVDKKEC